MDPTRSVNRDSDLDAGVIAHEYGHGISNRLTGGPNIVTCLNNAEQMGEGWSDWFGITLTTHPSDTALTPRGVGTYLIFQPTDGNGIRPTPYSTDMSVNPSTYASVANPAISQPHGIGYVWNTMLWEMYWNLVDRYGYNADIYGPWHTAGNNRALQLVMDGLKLQVCRPGFVDGRDAILAADTALTGGANQCEIWRAFAKRGLGASASQGSSADRFDGVPAFNLPAACTTAAFGGFKSPVDEPARHQQQERRGHRSPQVHAVGRRRLLGDRLADDRLRHPRARRRRPDRDRNHSRAAERQPVSHQLENRFLMGGDVPEGDPAHPRRERRGGVLQLPLAS